MHHCLYQPQSVFTEEVEKKKRSTKVIILKKMHHWNEIPHTYRREKIKVVAQHKKRTIRY